MGYKVFAAGEEALASDVNSLLMSQTVSRFATAAARTAAIAAPVLNQLSMRDDRLGAIERWNGTAWVDLAVTTQLAYGERTSQLAIGITPEASPHSLLATSAITLDGATAVMVDFYMPSVAPGAAMGSAIQFWLYQNGVSVGRLAYVQNNANAGPIMPIFTSRRLTPSSGSHVYGVGAGAVVADGTVYCGPGGTGQYMPSFLRVTRA
jgi:hypothetical protein